MLARYQLRPGVSEPLASSSAMTASASGCRPQSRKLAQPSFGEPVLGDVRELEEEHVPRLLVLLEAAGPEARRVAHREGDEMVDPIGRHRGEHPGHRGAPVVPDHMRPLHAGLVEHGADIGHQKSML